jgi:hypothetical protein
MSKNTRLWSDDISNADPAEQRDMDRQPTGWVIVWGFGAVLIWIAIALIVCFVFIK